MCRIWRWPKEWVEAPSESQQTETSERTPCAGNAVTLLTCALASLHLGDAEQAQRLEQAAEDLGMEGYDAILDPLYVDIALARRDLDEVERKLREWSPRGLGDTVGLVARLNALVALEGAEIEQEAPALVKPDTYFEPFALRALGAARQDERLVDRAIQRFEAMGLTWHAAETRKLLVSARN